MHRNNTVITAIGVGVAGTCDCALINAAGTINAIITGSPVMDCKGLANSRLTDLGITSCGNITITITSQTTNTDFGPSNSGTGDLAITPCGGLYVLVATPCSSTG